MGEWKVEGWKDRGGRVDEKNCSPRSHLGVISRADSWVEGGSGRRKRTGSKERERKSSRTGERVAEKRETEKVKDERETGRDQDTRDREGGGRGGGLGEKEMEKAGA